MGLFYLGRPKLELGLADEKFDVCHDCFYHYCSVKLKIDSEDEKSVFNSKLAHILKIAY